VGGKPQAARTCGRFMTARHSSELLCVLPHLNRGRVAESARCKTPTECIQHLSQQNTAKVSHQSHELMYQMSFEKWRIEEGGFSVELKVGNVQQTVQKLSGAVQYQRAGKETQRDPPASACLTKESPKGLGMCPISKVRRIRSDPGGDSQNRCGNKIGPQTCRFAWQSVAGPVRACRTSL
jgi:hypothetical protein